MCECESVCECMGVSVGAHVRLCDVSQHTDRRGASRVALVFWQAQSGYPVGMLVCQIGPVEVQSSPRLLIAAAQSKLPMRPYIPREY